MSNSLESCRSTSSRVGGIILTSILYEDSLVYLLAAMKRHGLLKQFENLVAGFSHIETVFKKKNICRKVFNLRYLDRFLQAAGVTTTQGLGNLETQSSQVLARVGYEALNHVMVIFFYNLKHLLNFLRFSLELPCWAHKSPSFYKNIRVKGEFFPLVCLLL